MNTLWQIELLGGLKAYRQGQEPLRFQTRKSGAILAFLAYHLQQERCRDTIVETFWPEADPANKRHSLSQALTTLRRLLEADLPDGSVLQATYTHIRLNPATVETDVAAFTAALNAARQSRDPIERLRLLQQALAHYKGELLPGYFESWVLAERERLIKAHVYALRQSALDLQQLGDAELALEYALQAAAAAPEMPEPQSDLVRLYMHLGRHTDAMRQYQKLARLLQRDGAKPPEEIRSLARQLRYAVGGTASGGASSPAVSTPPQTARPASPPPPTAAASPPAEARPVTARLPLKLTRFFGREKELARLEQILQPASRASMRAADPLAEEESARLVTLIGPGGAGKTRLAIEAARRLTEPFAQAVTFVPLADVTDPEGIADTVLKALGRPRSPNRPALDQVVAALTGRPALLILDNCEHLIQGCAEVAWTLLERLPSLSCLATSRQPLGLDGEIEQVVPPLPVPTQPGSPERLMEFACVQMFVDRAQKVRPGFEVTAQNGEYIVAVCQRLEGLPLAIELAAARAQVLTPAQMLKQLEARFDFLVSRREQIDARHRTLREAIAWSYQLLPMELQQFFARLSVFRGGWTLEAAQAVCMEPEALDFTEQLLQRSLLMAEEQGDTMRFQMLETLRDFAAEQLRETDRDATRRRHAEFYLEFAEEAQPHLRGSARGPWMERLDAERENFRAALAWAEAEEIGLRLAGALWPFWLMRGSVGEGRRFLTEVLTKNLSAAPEMRAKALNGLGNLARRQGDFEPARKALEESLTLCRASGDEAGLAQTLNNLALLADAQGDHAQARAYNEESLEILRALDDRWSIAGALNNLGRRAQELGDLDAACDCFQECHQIYQELGDVEYAALALHNLGSVAMDKGDLEVARGAFEHSLALFREMGNRSWVAILLRNLGEVLYLQGDYALARPLLKESLMIHQEAGDKSHVARVLISLSHLARSEGYPRRALRLLAAAQAAYEAFEMPLDRSTRALYDENLSALRAALTDKEFAYAWRYGHVMPLKRAVAYALDQPVSYAPTPSVLLNLNL